MGLGENIRKSLEDRWLMRFDTNHPDGDAFHGVVTVVQRGFIALREDRDLRFDGIIVLPKHVLDGSRNGGYEKCVNAIHRQAEDLDAAQGPEWLGGCKTVADVLAALHERDIWPGIEVVFEGDDGPQSAFYVGPIVGVEDDHVLLHCYDAHGEWEKIYEIGYDEIFKVVFEDDYTKRFNAYMRACGPARPA